VLNSVEEVCLQQQDPGTAKEKIMFLIVKNKVCFLLFPKQTRLLNKILWALCLEPHPIDGVEATVLVCLALDRQCRL